MPLITPLYRLFVLAAMALLAASFFTSRQTLDLHLHDTFYILDLSYLLRVTPALFPKVYRVSCGSYLVGYSLLFWDCLVES
jgi:hypothetical protein